MSIESVIPSNHLILCHSLSSCLQSFLASGSFPMSQFFASGAQSIGASASASVLLMNIQDWSPLGLTGLISWTSGSSVDKESARNAGDPSSIPGLGKIPWRRERLPTPVFWPGEFRGQSMRSQRVGHYWDFHFTSLHQCGTQDIPGWTGPRESTAPPGAHLPTAAWPYWVLSNQAKGRGLGAPRQTCRPGPVWETLPLTKTASLHGQELTFSDVSFQARVPMCA